MIKRYIRLAIATVFFTLVMFVNSVTAIELDDASRTVLENEQGKMIVMSPEQYTKGKKLFGSECSKCHGQGMTKTNPNVGMDLESLSLATPPRNNMEGMVAFLKEPKSFDGEVDVSLFHPSIESADIYKGMRNLTEDDLVDLASFVLIEPKVNKSWGAGKSSR